MALYSHQNMLGFCKIRKSLSPVTQSNQSSVPLWVVLVAQSCPPFCDPMDYSSPGSSVHGIVPARIQEWVAIPFSRGSSRPRDWTLVSCMADRFFIIWVTREAPSAPLMSSLFPPSPPHLGPRSHHQGLSLKTLLIPISGWRGSIWILFIMF